MIGGHVGFNMATKSMGIATGLIFHNAYKTSYLQNMLKW